MSRIPALMTCWLAMANVFLIADDGANHTKILTEAETQLKAIYDEREFAPATFSGKWLRDSSGYMVLEKPEDGSEPELVQYDVLSGNRSIVLGGETRMSPPFLRMWLSIEDH